MRRYILATAFGSILLGFLYVLYSGRFNGFSYDDVFIIVPLVIVLLGVPIALTGFLYLLLSRFEKGKLVALIVGMLSVVAHGVFFGFWIGEQAMKAYKKNGVRTCGVVERSFNSHGPRMYYSFTANGIYYRSDNVHNPRYRMEGDSVEVIYNSQNPDMNSALENLDE